MKKSENRFKNTQVKTLMIVLALLVLGIGSMVGIYNILLSNAGTMGMELIRSYAADEERNIAVYKAYVKMGLYYLEETEETSYSEELLKYKMNSFLKKTVAVTGDKNLRVCALKNGVEIASNKGTGQEKEDYRDACWYQEAEAAAGDVVFCDLSSENEESDDLTAVAAMDPGSGNAMVVFLNRNNYEKVHSDLKLMDQGAYYLFDGEGKLLFYEAPFQVDKKEIEEYAGSLCKKIRNGDQEKTGGGIVDLTGKKRDIYHSSVSNGWLCIMTVPRTVLLKGFYRVLWNCGGILAVVLLAMLGLYIRDLRRGNSVHYINLMMQALSNTYYAIYRINLKEETYVRIKGSLEVVAKIPDQGSYEEMLDGFVTVLDENTGEELRSSFSLENIKKAVDQGIQDYGGDFLRELDGEKRWVNIGVIRDDILGKDEVIFVFRQIDAEKKKQLQHTKLLEDALDAAEAGEKAQQKFFAGMSHEMRTPLNIILGMNELAMRENCSAEKRLDYQKKIQQEAERMTAMVNDLLEMSRPEHALIPLQRKTMNLTETLNDILKPYRKRAEEEGKYFTTETDVDCPVVMGDALKLEKILYAVLSNALRFTNPGDSIHVALHQAGIDNKNYIFTVEDTGIGMSKKFLPRLFEPYSIEKRFGDRSASGDGLGMAIARNLVIQKGGQIRAESEEGKGTKIIITLPFAPDKEVEKKAEPEAEQKPEKTKEPENCLEGLRILVVDDNEMNREFVGELLEEKGAVVTLASGGKESVEMFSNSEPFAYDVILMDIMMPETDGCEAARLIRSQNREDAGAVLILALTANSFAEDVIRTMEAGMNAHLVKPLNMQVLQETLKKLLKKNNE